MQPTSTDPLAVHRGVMQAAGPQSLADITSDLSDAETAMLQRYLAQEPTHAQVLQCVDSTGRIVDRAALDELAARCIRDQS